MAYRIPPSQRTNWLSALPTERVREVTILSAPCTLWLSALPT